MEDPSTWTDAERVINTIIKQHDEQTERIVGWSLTRRIAKALGDYGLLKNGGNMPAAAPALTANEGQVPKTTFVTVDGDQTTITVGLNEDARAVLSHGSMIEMEFGEVGKIRVKILYT